MTSRTVLTRIVESRRLPHDAVAVALVGAGIVAIGVALGFGAQLGDYAGRLFSVAPGQDAQRLAGNIIAQPAWIIPLGLLGLAAFMSAAAVLLRRIVNTIGVRRDGAMLLARVAASPVHAAQDA